MSLTNYIGVIVTSAFCACHKCVADKPLTSMGTKPIVGRTVSAPRSIPLGTRVYIEGLGWRTVETRAARRFDHRWDVYVGDRTQHRKALELGLQERKAWVVR